LLKINNEKIKRDEKIKKYKIKIKINIKKRIEK
jgi:hypothetical protein